MRAFCRILLAASTLAATAATAHGAAIPVTTTIDGSITNPQTQDGLCSLREAVVAAVNDAPVQGCPAGSGADTVVLGAGTFTLSQPGFNEDQGFTGDLDVGGPPVRVTGTGPGASVISVAIEDRAFDVRPGGDLTLEGLSVRGAQLPDQTSANGAGVRNQGRLTILRVEFDGNRTGLGSETVGTGGGAIWSGNTATASVVVTDSTFTRNEGGTGSDGGGDGGHGGAIRIESGTLTVRGSTFAGNLGGVGRGGSGPLGGAGGNGGAIAVGPGTATISTSTFTANRGGSGGTGEDGTNTSGGNGGAVWVSGGQALIEWSTFLGNARGASSLGPNSIVGAIVGSSILADPEPRCGGVVASAPNLLSGPDAVCLPGSAVGDPRLGLLGANGGPTLTLLPGAGSAAINGAGAGCPATDQRGLPRPALGACDFGAVEIQPGAPGAPGAPAPGGAGGAAGTRTITALTLGPTAFRATGRKPLGTDVRFRLGTGGTVVITVTRAAAGKRSGRRCVAPSRRLKSAKKCTRQVTLPGSLRKAGTAGANTVRFSGKLRGKALAPGAYTLVLTLPKAGPTAAVTARKSFRIIR